MKTKMFVVATLLGAAALSAQAGIGLGISINVPVPPPVVVVAPAPVMVPDSYAWDGTEYVGLVGGQYFYLGPGNVWLACDAPRLARFQGWERGHPDWRNHAIRNERYRNDAHGHVQPLGHGPEKESVRPAPARMDKDKY